MYERHGKRDGQYAERDFLFEHALGEANAGPVGGEVGEAEAA